MAAVLGWFLIVAGGVLGLAPATAARIVNAVRLWPPPTRMPPEVVRSCRIAGFTMAVLGLVLVMPGLT